MSDNVSSIAEFDSVFRMEKLDLLEHIATPEKACPIPVPGAVHRTEFDKNRPMPGKTMARAATTVNNSNSCTNLKTTAERNRARSRSSSSTSSASAGSSASKHSAPQNTFSSCDSSSFQLRVGPNYAKTGAKAPAGSPLYEIVAVE
jgi:hypothetical protein